MKPRYNLEGKHFNRLEVISFNEKISKKNNEAYWNCRCICGNEKVIYGYSLRTESSKSCGCLREETSFNTRNTITQQNLKLIKHFKKSLDKQKSIINLETEKSWAAGFFDGEGCTTFNQTIRMSLAQVEIEPLNRFLNIVKCGKIRGPYKYGNNKQYYYQWNSSGIDVIKVASLLWSYLSSIKKQQFSLNINKYLERLTYEK